MTDLLIILHMFRDLMTGGDPTLPAGHNDLAPIAQAFAVVYDLILTIVGK